MTLSDTPHLNRAQSYAQHQGHAIIEQLGFGQDGTVYQSDRPSAIKVFERPHSFATELSDYQLLTQHKVLQVNGHHIPQLLNHDNNLQLIEISIVQPPHILDFAKATLDTPPDFPPEVMAERYQHWADNFEDRWSQALDIINHFKHHFGIHLLDPSPANIAFLDD